MCNNYYLLQYYRHYYSKPSRLNPVIVKEVNGKQFFFSQLTSDAILAIFSASLAISLAIIASASAPARFCSASRVLPSACSIRASISGILSKASSASSLLCCTLLSNSDEVNDKLMIYLSCLKFN